MNKNLTLGEVLALKEKAETQMLEALADFAAETGIVPHGARWEIVTAIGKQDVPISVTLEVRL